MLYLFNVWVTFRPIIHHLRICVDIFLKSTGASLHADGTMCEEVSSKLANTYGLYAVL